MLLADKPALGAVIIEDRGRIAVNAHLVLDRAAHDAVAFADAAIGARQELRHEEERDALRARRRPLDACEDEMNDVVGQVVLAGRDENFLTRDGVGAVRLRDGLRLDEPEIGAAMRFGQVHRAGPLADRQLGQITRFQVVIAVRHQRRDGAAGEARIHREGDIGGTLVFAEERADEHREALAAICGIARQPDPAALDQRLVGLFEALGGGHAAVIVALATLHVADAIERLDDLLDEFGAFAQDRLDNVDRRLGKAGGVRVLSIVEDVAQQEDGVAHRRLVSRHPIPRFSRKSRAQRRARLHSAAIRFTCELLSGAMQAKSCCNSVKDESPRATDSAKNSSATDEFEPPRRSYGSAHRAQPTKAKRATCPH